MRWKITIEYHGGAFVGWQRQINGQSVQQLIEKAIHRFSSEDVRIMGAGRTDSGVHAEGQVAHFDLNAKPWTGDVVRDAINAHLRPHLISILSAEHVADNFDARLHAKRRHYRYRILNRRTPEALEFGLVWHVSRELDETIMNDTAQMLVGRHDFTSFRATQCQARSPIKSIETIRVERTGSHVQLFVTAPSFLHHQVRNIVGTLKLVGEGKWTPDEFRIAFEARARPAGGPTAPPEGLYFVGVEY